MRVDDQYVKRTFGLVLSVLIFVAPAHAADPGFVLHKRVREVRLTVVATDAAGRPWPQLTESNLAVADEGRPVTDFQVRSANDLPLRIGVLVDLSDSTRRSWPIVRTALTDAMSDLIRPGDQILMTSFANKITSQSVLTRPQELAEALPNSPGGLTALYDALHASCGNSLFADGVEPKRSAIILFSDGEDSLSYHGLADTVALAQQNGVAIYTITTHNPSQSRRGDNILRYIASSTGGRDFVVKDHQALQSALQSIHDELRNSYLLYYHPLLEHASNGFRRVEVLPASNANLRLRTRAGYYPAP
jgi:Ca-activated chloride channel homolog